MKTEFFEIFLKILKFLNAFKFLKICENFEL